jgi:hypothetical protein
MPSQINQIPKMTFPELPPQFQLIHSQMVDAINGLLGKNGPIPLANHLDMAGFRIMNVGAPEADTDALSSGVAEDNYSVSALAPQLESSSSTGLKSMRRLNDTNQREQSSSYLNDLMSSVPNANEIVPIISNVGAQVQVIIPMSLFTFADGSTIELISRTDLLAKPAQYTITSISSTGNIVTVVLSAASGITAGQAATITGVTPSSFNGTFEIASSTGGGTTLTYQLDLGTTSGSGGYVQTNSVWYYCVKKRDPTVHLLGPFMSDTMQNRLQANFDQFSIVAVVVVTDNGAQVQLSGGGGSPITGASPAAGAFFAWFFLLLSLAGLFFRNG